MTSRLTGVAILDRTLVPERLHVLCQVREVKSAFSLPVYDTLKPAGQDQPWTYTRRGNILDLRLTMDPTQAGKTGKRERLPQVEFAIVTAEDYDPGAFGSPLIQLEAANRINSGRHD